MIGRDGDGPGSTLTASMYRDVIAGRSVEVEQVFVDLAARARALSVDSPFSITMNLRVRQHRLRA